MSMEAMVEELEYLRVCDAKGKIAPGSEAAEELAWLERQWLAGRLEVTL